jgi:hypothetical protein
MSGIVPWVAVRHAPDDGGGAVLEFAQWPVVLGGQLELRSRNRVAVRVVRGVPEGGVDARLERL